MNLYAMMVMGLNTLRAKFIQLKKSENGGAEIIAVVVLIAIVVVLGVAFKSQIADLIKNIWSGITGNTADLNASVDLGGGTP